MSGIRRSARPWARAGLVLGLVAGPLSGTGVAAAETRSVTPVIECVILHPGGGYTAVLGYDNPSTGTVTVPVGPENKITPASAVGGQPDTFLPGRQRGVFSLTVANGTPTLRWTLDGSTASVQPRESTCPPPTEMPADGNGTGLAIGLGAAGLVGWLVVRRTQRRTAAAAVAGPVHPEADHA
jgi:hypothetical protein